MTRTFLVVDDDPDLQVLLRTALRRWGHRTLVAADLDDARRLCVEERPDVLLLDVTMPEMDGPAFLTELRERGIDPPRVYLLSALDPSVLAELADALDVRYLVKPFTLQSLREGLADVLDGGPPA